MSLLLLAVLAETRTVTISVVTDEGEPVPYEMVASAPDFELTEAADPTGTVSMTVPVDRAWLKFVTKQDPATGQVLELWHRYGRFGDGHPRDVRESYRFTLPPLANVGGVVLDSGGQPIEGAEVRFSCGEPQHGWHMALRHLRATTDAGGRWRWAHCPDPDDVPRMSVRLVGKDVPNRFFAVDGPGEQTIVAERE